MGRPNLPPSHGSPWRDPNEWAPPRFIFCAEQLRKVRKISRKLIGVLTAGGPPCAGMSTCAEASDTEGLEKIDGRCLRLTTPHVSDITREWLTFLSAPCLTG